MVHTVHMYYLESSGKCLYCRSVILPDLIDVVLARHDEPVILIDNGSAFCL